MSTTQKSDPSCDTIPAAAEVFNQSPDAGNGSHCVITLLCTLKDEAARKQYLALTREIAFPVKAAHPSCIRVTQTIPKNTDSFQVLWVEEWTNSSDFTNTMKSLFKTYPRLSKVNEYLTCNPTVTVSRMITNADIA